MEKFSRLFRKYFAKGENKMIDIETILVLEILGIITIVAGIISYFTNERSGK
jgi:hypothetical protein